MGESQISQPEVERYSYHQDSTARPLVSWVPEEASRSSSQVCVKVGDTIVCTNDIYGSTSAKPAFRAIYSLQESMGLIPSAQVYRAADTQPPPYYPPGTYMSPTAGQPLRYETDPYTYNQGTRPGQAQTPADRAGTGGVDPFSFHQGDKNPSIVPPYLKPNVNEFPAVPLPPLPDQRPNPPVDTRPQPPQPCPETNPYQPRPYQPGQPCQPCQPCNPGGRHGGGWYPGKIAGRVLGRVFGGRCR